MDMPASAYKDKTEGGEKRRLVEESENSSKHTVCVDAARQSKGKWRREKEEEGEDRRTFIGPSWTSVFFFFLVEIERILARFYSC